MEFKKFIEATEEDKNVRDTLKKLPANHRKLIAGYKFQWQSGNTLKNDDEHIGIINPKNKTITVAAPWRYPRQFTVLHEIAHKVFNRYMTPKLKKEWSAIVKRTKHKLKQNDEELWCMNYANYFADNKIVVHTHPKWELYMKKFIKITS